MKVCFFEASEGIGRGEIYVDLANCLADNYDEISELILISPAGAKYLKRLHPKVRHVPLFCTCTRNNPMLYLEILWILFTERPSLVHTHFNKATQIYKRLSYFLTVPWLATKHNVRSAKVYENIPNVVAVSRQVADSLARKDVDVIHNGVDMPVSYLCSAVQPRPIRLISIGRLVSVKGFAKLIRAIERVAQSLDCRLTIVGDGEERTALVDQIEECGLNDRVNLLGYREDIEQLIHEHDVLIVSSESEGFGMVLLEGFHWAPVVLSTPVGIAEELLPSECILRGDDYSEQLLNLLSDFSELFRLTELRRGEPIKFTLKATAENYMNYYKKLVGGGSCVCYRTTS